MKWDVYTDTKNKMWLFLSTAMGSLIAFFFAIWYDKQTDVSRIKESIVQ